MANGGVVERLRAGLRGPAPVLPKALDGLAEGWASLSARGRLAVAASAVALLVAAAGSWASGVAARWGGEPVTVLVADAPLAPGDQALGLRTVQLPPAAVPPGAVTAVPEGARLAFALPAGSVLTRAHLDPRGPAAGLAPGLRAMPVPVEEGWGVAAGGWVDVWVLGGDAPSRLVARGCAVLEVSQADTGQGTALVALPAGAVGDVAQGLALGQVLLAHAPPAEGGHC